MKKISRISFVAIFLAIANVGISQTISDSFYLSMTHIFQHVDTSHVSTGLLKDYGMDFADVINFDGVQVSDTNIVYSNIWNDLYTSLYTYRFTNAPSLLSPDSVFNSQASLAQSSNFVPLSLMFYQYSMYKDHAADNGLATVSNGQIYDKYVNGVWQNPYQQNTLMAVTAGKDMFNQSSITFQLPAALKFTNYTNIQSIQGDFADGNGYRNITPGSSFTINYADTGQKIIQFKITLSDSKVFTSRTGIWVYYDSTAYSQRKGIAEREDN